MKPPHGRKNDFSKFAWFSRSTAPVINLDLIIKCHNLPKKDLLSQADAFCVLWKVPDGCEAWGVKGVPAKLPARQEEEIGRTEVSRSCPNPIFKHRFRLEFIFYQEQNYILRVFDEDLRYATDLNEHDYLGGCVFTLGQLMGARGNCLAKVLKGGEDSYLVVTGEEVIENLFEFRFSCQDLVKEHNKIIDIIDKKQVIDKCRPYFRLERWTGQSWEIVWKSEVKKQTLDPVWNEARLPLQLLCNDDHHNPLKITIWDYEKNSSSHVIMGFVESSIADIIEKSKDGGIPVFIIWKEKKKLFRGSKLKQVGLLKVLNASVIIVPSMLQYLSGGTSLDLMLGIDCSVVNGEWGTQNNLHFFANNYLNDYQAGIQKLGTITENFSRGRHSSLWGIGAVINNKYRDYYVIKERLCEGKQLLKAYNDNIIENNNFSLGEQASLNPLIEEATFRSIRLQKKRPCYTVLAIFTAGDFIDLQETVDLICTAAEDAPLSILIIGVGNNDFSFVEKLSHKLCDSRGIPIAREIVTFVTFKQFSGNATKVIAEALKEIPEQFVEYHLMNGTKPLPAVPPPNFDRMASPPQKKKGKTKTKNKIK